MIREADMQRWKSLSRATRGGTLDPLQLAQRAYDMGSAACHDSITKAAVPETLNLTELERRALMKAFETTGNILAASKILGIGKPPHIER